MRPLRSSQTRSIQRKSDMVAYSFKPRFVDPILWGRKDQTIRAPRNGTSQHAAVGQELQLYTGMRTKACRLILRTTCTERLSVLLRWRPIIEFQIDGERLDPSGYEAFARRDGFADVADMEAFWAGTHGPVEWFRGEIIRWLPPSAPVEIGV